MAAATGTVVAAAVGTVVAAGAGTVVAAGVLLVPPLSLIAFDEPLAERWADERGERQEHDGGDDLDLARLRLLGGAELGGPHLRVALRPLVGHQVGHRMPRLAGAVAIGGRGGHLGCRRRQAGPVERQEHRLGVDPGREEHRTADGRLGSNRGFRRQQLVVQDRR